MLWHVLISLAEDSHFSCAFTREAGLCPPGREHGFILRGPPPKNFLLVRMAGPVADYWGERATQLAKKEVGKDRSSPPNWGELSLPGIRISGREPPHTSPALPTIFLGPSWASAHSIKECRNVAAIFGCTARHQTRERHR